MGLKDFEFFCFEKGKFWLKSDQNGIERKGEYTGFSIAAVLKSDQNGIESINVSSQLFKIHPVKIRPKWD